MESLGPNGTDILGPDLVTAEQVRELPLHDITQQYGTVGLHVRLEDTLSRKGLSEIPEVQWALQLGLMLHADDKRTNGPYDDHLLRVTLRLIDHFDITDPEIIAAAPLHDSVEDHARDVVRVLSGEIIEDETEAKQRALELLGEYLSPITVSLIEGVTNPKVLEGEDPFAVYVNHFKTVILPDPKKRVLKLADFGDNGPGNHYTKGEKQLHLDRKYDPLYQLHERGLSMPDSLVIGKRRDRAIDQLRCAQVRARTRLESA